MQTCTFFSKRAITYGNLSPMQDNGNDENKTWRKLYLICEKVYFPLFWATLALLWKGLTRYATSISVILIIPPIAKLFLGGSSAIKEWINIFPWWLWWILSFAVVTIAFFRANHKKHMESFSKIDGLQEKLKSIEKARPEFTFYLSDDEQDTLLARIKVVSARWYRIGVTNSSPSVPAEKCHIDIVDIKPKPVNFTLGPLLVTNETSRETDISPGATKSFGLVWLRLDKVHPDRQAFIPVHLEIPLMNHKEYTVTLKFTGCNFSPIDGIYVLRLNDNSLSVDDRKGFATVSNNDTPR